MILKKDLLCLLLQQEEDALIKIRINSGIPLLIQGGVSYSEPKNLFRSRGGPFPSHRIGRKDQACRQRISERIFNTTGEFFKTSITKLSTSHHQMSRSDIVL